MTDAPERLYFYDDWLEKHTKGKLLCGNNEYIRADVSDALVAAESAKGFDRGVRDAQPIVDSLRAQLLDLKDALGIDPIAEVIDDDPEDARAALDRIRQEARKEGYGSAIHDALNAIANENRQNPEGNAGDEALRCAHMAVSALITKDAE